MRLSAAITLVLLPAIASADSKMRVASGSRVEIRRGDGLPPGLERGMPRGTAYERGIALDAEGRHIEAAREYASAVREWDGLASVTAATSECVAAWRGKAIWQREESEALLEQEAYVATLPSSAIAHFNLATGYHNKALAVRAWNGGDATDLFDKAASEYRRAIELDRGHLGARVGLATVDAQLGRAGEARRAMASLGRRADDRVLALAIAAWHAAVGEREEAMARLSSLPLRPDQRRWLFRSNDFDALRDDPRFRSLVAAEPGSECDRDR